MCWRREGLGDLDRIEITVEVSGRNVYIYIYILVGGALGDDWTVRFTGCGRWSFFRLCRVLSSLLCRPLRVCKARISLLRFGIGDWVFLWDWD